MPGFLLKLAQSKESRSRLPVTSQRIPKRYKRASKPYQAQKCSEMLQDGQGQPITVSFEHSIKARRKLPPTSICLKSTNLTPLIKQLLQIYRLLTASILNFILQHPFWWASKTHQQIQGTKQTRTRKMSPSLFP